MLKEGTVDLTFLPLRANQKQLTLSHCHNSKTQNLMATIQWFGSSQDRSTVIKSFREFEDVLILPKKSGSSLNHVSFLLDGSMVPSNHQT